jgi:hypothetical protein
MRIQPLYDSIGKTYTASRATNPKLAASIMDALGDAASVANVGAGAGAYEPRDRDVIAIEPSAVMVAASSGQRARAPSDRRSDPS